ncbi:MAG: DUF2089 domain-containing protein [Clostridia bacterium]|jgi:hypothetical protein
MKNFVPSQCPICEGELIITDMVCKNCKTHISGEFYTTKLAKLDPNQLEFVEAFIKCRGSIKEMEKELKISYPTVKSRLEIVAKTMGYNDEKQEDDTRMKVLDSIEKGEMTVEEALKILK